MNKTCPNCHAPLSEGARFCTSCGCPIPAEEPAPQQEAPVYAAPESASYQQPAAPVYTEAPAYSEPPVDYTAPVAAPLDYTPPADAPAYDARLYNSMPADYAPPAYTGAPASYDAPQYMEEPAAYQDPSYYQPPQPPQPEEPKKKKGKKGLVIGIVLAAVLLLLGGAFWFLYSQCYILQPTVDLNQYVNVDFKGFNGYGSASVAFDEEAFVSAAQKALRDSGGISKSRKASAIAEAAGENLEFTAATGSAAKLKNGEEYEIGWSEGFSAVAQRLEQQYRVKISYSDFTVTVEDLKEVPVKELFDTLEVEYSGVDGYGTARVVQKGSDDAFWDVNWTVTPAEGLSNGDKITVAWKLADTYKDIGEFVEVCQYIPATESKTFTVEGLQTVREIDPFEYVGVEFTGTGPKGEGHATFDSKAFRSALGDDAPYLDLKNSSFKNLSNGDTITLDLDTSFSDEELLELYALRLTRRSMTVTVSGLSGKYLRAFEDLSEDAMKTLDAQALEFLTKEELNKLTATYGSKLAVNNVTLVGHFIYISKLSGLDNCYLVLYKLDLTVEGNLISYYSYVLLNDVVVNDNGAPQVKGKLEIPLATCTYKNGTYTFHGVSSLERFVSVMIEPNRSKTSAILTDIS